VSSENSPRGDTAADHAFDLLLSITVSETRRNRAYWASQPWVTGAKIADLRSADLVMFPWESKGDNSPPLYPRGSAELFRTLAQNLLNSTLTLGVAEQEYFEMSQHADEWRLPTLLVSSFLLPMLAQILGNEIDRWISQSDSDAVLQTEMIIEGHRGRCISFKYKGPPSKFLDTMSEYVADCLDAEGRQTNERRREQNLPRRK
jgi:hypothetical protein